MSVIIQVRRGTAAEWTAANPILASGEFGYETNTGKLKLGDSTTVWNSLAYYSSGTATAGGSDTQVQFNDSGTFAGDSGLTYNKTTDILTINGTLTITDGFSPCSISLDDDDQLTISRGSTPIWHVSADSDDSTFVTPVFFDEAIKIWKEILLDSHIPASFSDGMIWFYNGHLYLRVGGLSIQLDRPVYGTDTQIIFNKAGITSGSADLIWNDTTKSLEVGGGITCEDLTTSYGTINTMAYVPHVTESELVLSDVTTTNSSTTKHGLLPKLSNVSTEFLNGQGAWATPAGSGGGTPGGSDTQVQFNDSSAFGGDAGLTYNKTTDTLSVKAIAQTDGGNTWTMAVDQYGEWTLKKGSTIFLTGSLDSDDMTSRVSHFFDEVTNFQKHITIASETPVSPVGGDIWYNGTDLMGRTSTTTQSLTAVNASEYATDTEQINKNLVICGNSLSKSTGIVLDSIYTARKIHNRGQGSETITQVKTRMLVDTMWQKYPTTFWPAYDPGTSTATAASEIDAMVAALDGGVNYLILSYIPDANTWLGSADYIALQTKNTYIATNYASHYFDVLAYLLTQGDGGANDNTDIANGVIPRSLRDDTIHLNLDGYTRVANQIINWWATDDATYASNKVTSYLEKDRSILCENLNILDKGYLEYAGLPMISGDHYLFNYFFGNSGNRSATGISNTAIGFAALRYLSSGSYNIAIGENALRANTTGAANNANGFNSLLSNTTGSSNSAYGQNSLYTNTTGYNNCAFGAGALIFNLDGFENSGFGWQSLYATTAGFYNAAIGSYSLRANTTGGHNCGLGAYSLRSQTTGYRNIGIGVNSLAGLTGSYNDNIGIGYESGRYITDGTTPIVSPSQCLFIGDYTKGVTTSDANEIVIGHSAQGMGSNTVTIGNSSITSTNLKGTVNVDKIAILEGGGTPTYRTTIQGGDQSANITLTLPTAAPAVNGYVLSSTTAGAMSWIAPSAGGSALSVARKTADYWLTNADNVIECDGTFNIFLTAFASATKNVYYIKNVGSGTITIEGDNLETIDGQPRIYLDAKDSVQIIPGTTEWIIL